MADSTTHATRTEAQSVSPILRFIPLVNTLRTYKRDYLSGDLIAGLIVAIMLIPQGMAYALLAGLPPQQGLYASVLPLLLYGLLGTSRYLAVGPVAIVSLLTASSVGAFAAEGSGEYLTLALTLAFLVAVIQTGMGFLRVGFLVNFLSHPVLVGFSAAAAIVIGFSQVKSLLGISIERSEHFYEQVLEVGRHLTQTNLITLAIGIAGILILLYFKNSLAAQLKRWNIPDAWALPITKTGPLLIVVIGTLLVILFDLNETVSVSVVGDVPAGLPPLTLPSFSIATWRTLLTTALAISFVGYMESISVAKSLASRGREKVDPNQELIALGVANFGAAFTGGYPVTGGFSRSLVNHSAGARTPLASVITALLIALSIVILTPLFYFIPKSILAAIIMVAVAGLIDLKTVRRVWKYDKRDAAALITTFIAVLAIGIENGILVGAVLSLVLFIWRTSDPHVAILGKLPRSNFYRNVLRHNVQTWPEIALVRIDASLYFANTKLLEQTISDTVADQPQLQHFVLVGTAINDVDFSALEALEGILHSLHANDIQLHLAAFKGPVLDKLKLCGFTEHIGVNNIHLTTHDAMQTLGFV